MATLAQSVPESTRLVAWFWGFLKAELAPYSGRGTTVARMVIAATITMVLIMVFRIPGGALGALYAFLVSRDDLRSTLHSGIATAVSYCIGIWFFLTGANLFADQPSTHFLWFVGCIFVVFLALQIVQDYRVATGFAVILLNALSIWQMNHTAEYRVEQTLWRALAVAVGTLVTIAVEAIFHAFYRKDELFQRLDERLGVVEGLIESYSRSQPIQEDVANRLAQYTELGVSGLRRILARSKHEQVYRDQLLAVIALVGRLVDLAAPSARTPHQLQDGDVSRLRQLVTKIAQIRVSLVTSKIPDVQSELTTVTSGIPLLAEMERTVALIPRIFSNSESIDGYLPSLLVQEEHSGGFFRNDAFQNQNYIQFALRGCLATTICYFTYEMLDWRGLATSVTTCVITALSNTGISRQKQVLRIAGAVAGGFVFGIGSQVFILPNIDSITEFSLLFAAVTAVAAWFATSSQRLSYFGIQLALAFYLVNLQEFTIQTSLAVARDRVAGILLGLSVMWLVFDRTGSASAAEEMVQSFTANLHAIADLALQPKGETPEEAFKCISTSRSRIGARFQTVNAQADAVLFEFGIRRESGMAARALIRGWQPQLQTLYLMEVALLQHRVYGADADLPVGFRDAQARFNATCATVLRQMADHLDENFATSYDDLDGPLRNLTQNLSAAGFTPVALTKAEGVTELCRQIRDQITKLAEEIGSRPIWGIGVSSRFGKTAAALSGRMRA